MIYDPEDQEAPPSSDPPVEPTPLPSGGMTDYEC